MRIASWNCCCAFRKKWEYLDAFGADLMVVPEAEEPARLPTELLERYPHHLWVGDIPYKGLLVMATAAYPLRVLDAYDPAHRYVLPVEVGGSSPITLMAVWSQRDKQRTYTEHLWHALHAYESRMTGRTVVIGDCNANTIWDKDHRRDVTHTQIVSWLAERGLESAYHHLTRESQGAESAATHAFRRNPESLFHIDYAFVSKPMLGDATITVPPVAEWVGHSDHGPLILDLPRGVGGSYFDSSGPSYL